MKRLSIPLALALTLAAGAAARQGEGKTDQDKIQGEWELVSQVLNGEADRLPDGGLVLTFRGDKVTTTLGGDPGEAEPYKLIETTDPRGIDVVKGKQTVRGLYELKGDTLRMAF